MYVLGRVHHDRPSPPQESQSLDNFPNCRTIEIDEHLRRLFCTRIQLNDALLLHDLNINTRTIEN